MTNVLKRLGGLTLAAGISLGSQAQELTVTLEIPAMSVAEYHKPYVAVWLEHKKSKQVHNIAVWYDTEMKNAEGEKWLKDMRQWWRRSGRSLAMPVDGVSGATQGPGQYDLSWSAGQPQLEQLVAGDYRLRVEAAREVGGRELINIPFSWPPTERQTLTASGESELADISLTLVP